MLKKLIIKLHSVRFFHYMAVGTSSFVLDMGTLFLLTEYFDFHPAVSVALNQVFILTYVFLMNKYWSFQSTGQTRKQLIRFFILTAFNYIFSITWMWIWVDALHFNFVFDGSDYGYIIARIVAIMLQVSWNFLLYRYWIYRHSTT